MRWRRSWPARKPRPEVRTLSDDEKKKLLAAMTEEITASPVLTGLGLQVRSQRGRFYLERPLGEGESAGVEAWGRMTPMADSDDLLLEQERHKGSWSEIARGSARKLVKIVSLDTKGTFHGLGALDKVLRESGKGLERLPVEREGKARFVYAGNGVECSAQEALFHYFRLPLHVLVEPSEWYSFHREPMIVEGSLDRSRVLVRFGATSWSGEGFGGTCLYACREGRWGAYRIRPSQSQDIATAEAWLVMRKWKQWGS
jgi:hypothetical protein